MTARSHRCPECGDRDCPGCDPADRPRGFINLRVVRERRRRQEPEPLDTTDAARQVEWEQQIAHEKHAQASALWPRAIAQGGYPRSA